MQRHAQAEQKNNDRRQDNFAIPSSSSIRIDGVHVCHTSHSLYQSALEFIGSSLSDDLDPVIILLTVDSNIVAAIEFSKRKLNALFAQQLMEERTRQLFESYVYSTQVQNHCNVFEINRIVCLDEALLRPLLNYLTLYSQLNQVNWIVCNTNNNQDNLFKSIGFKYCSELSITHDDSIVAENENLYFLKSEQLIANIRQINHHLTALNHSS